MKIEILHLRELDSGGAEVLISMDDQTKHWLINYAIIEILKNGLSEVKQLNEEHSNAGERAHDDLSSY